jgi:FkbM family methyltransferase
MSSSGALLAKIVRLPLSLIPRDAEVRVLRGPLRGMRWIKGSGPNACWFGTYEVSRLRTFANLIGDGAVVYDVGANVGIYSLLASLRAGPSGRVYAFEPLERNLRHLRRHITLNKLRNCTVLEQAVCNEEGTRSFSAAGLDSSMAHLAPDGELRVSSTTLDNCVYGEKRLRPPDIIKSMSKARSSKYWKAAIASSPNSTLRFFSRSTARSCMPTAVRFCRKRVIASTKDTPRSQLLLDYDRPLVRS